MTHISHPKPFTWRNEKHRRNVAALNCVVCGRHGPSQCAHMNATKGLGLKADDSLCFPACPPCHSAHDQGGVYGSKEARWQKEWEYVDATRAELISRNQWGSEVEQNYKRAIQPISRVVHAELEVAQG